MSVTRRAALLAAAGSAALAATTSTGQPDWTQIRRQFALKKDLLYFNAANIGAAPTAVWRAYDRQQADFQADPSFQNRDVYKTLAESVRSQIAAWVKAPAESIAITRNTSESSNLIAQGLRLLPGDQILLTGHNHPSNLASWQLHAARTGASVVLAPVPVLAQSPSDIMDSLTPLVTPRTRVIAFSHLTNTTGLLYPIADIVALAKKSGAWVHVDGAQTFGWMQLDLAAWDIDSYSGSFSKWPMGPLESGILYVKAGRLDEVEPAIVSHGYWADKPTGPRKFEELGQRDDPKLRAIEATLAFHQSLGPAAIEARTLAIATKLRDAVRALPGAELKSSGHPSVTGPVIKINFPGKDIKALGANLWARHKVACAPTPSGDAAGLRLSPHIYNLDSEVDALVAAIKEAV